MSLSDVKHVCLRLPVSTQGREERVAPNHIHTMLQEPGPFSGTAARFPATFRTNHRFSTRCRAHTRTAHTHLNSRSPPPCNSNRFCLTSPEACFPGEVGMKSNGGAFGSAAVRMMHDAGDFCFLRWQRVFTGPSGKYYRYPSCSRHRPHRKEWGEH